MVGCSITGANYCPGTYLIGSCISELQPKIMQVSSFKHNML